jgi:hypothetical protein
MGIDKGLVGSLISSAKDAADKDKSLNGKADDNKASDDISLDDKSIEHKELHNISPEATGSDHKPNDKKGDGKASPDISISNKGSNDISLEDKAGKDKGSNDIAIEGKVSKGMLGRNRLILQLCQMEKDDFDPDDIRAAIEEADSKQFRLGVFSPELSSALRFIQSSIPKYSISDEVRDILAPALEAKYPGLLARIRDELECSGKGSKEN